MSGFAEVIGRDARDAGEPSFPVQLKQVRVRPDVGTVVIDINRNISDQADPFLPAVTFEGEPLFKKKKDSLLQSGDVTRVHAELLCFENSSHDLSRPGLRQFVHELDLRRHGNGSKRHPHMVDEV